MKYGCCADISQYDVLVRAGCDAITLSAASIAGASPDEFDRMCAAIGAGPLALTNCNDFCGPQLKLAGEGYDAKAVTAYTQPLLERAARLGIRDLGLGAPKSRSAAPGEDPARVLAQFEAATALICELSAPYGIGILLEAICAPGCNLVTYTEQACALIKKLSLPNLRLVYDIYHAHRMGESPAVLAQAAPLLRVAHVSGDSAQGRSFPDASDAQWIAPYMRALRETGYDGELAVEALTGDPAAALAGSLSLLKEMN